jgi:hypothetical protein
LLLVRRVRGLLSLAGLLRFLVLGLLTPVAVLAAVLAVLSMAALAAAGVVVLSFLSLAGWRPSLRGSLSSAKQNA